MLYTHVILIKYCNTETYFYNMYKKIRFVYVKNTYVKKWQYKALLLFSHSLSLFQNKLKQKNVVKYIRGVITIYKQNKSEKD